MTEKDDRDRANILVLDKILQVENYEPHVHLMKSYCPDWGGPGQSQWFSAPTVEGATQIIHREGNNFQLVIVDLGLDDYEGIKTIEQLRPLTASPIAVCTGNEGALKEITRRSKELGIYGVILKAVTFTREKVVPILRDAYTTWRDEVMVPEVAKLNADIKRDTARLERLRAEAADRRAKWLQAHGL